MPGTIAPFPRHAFYDSNGNPLAGGKVFVYDAGTSTKATTYTDAALGSANTNPIVLSAAGQATIFLAPGSYKFVLAPAADSDPPLSPIWTVDGVSSVPSSTVDVDVAGTAGEDLALNDVCYLSAGDGGRTAGRWYKADADEYYSSTRATVLGFVTAAVASGIAGTFRITGRVTGLTSLSLGAVYYISGTAGAITVTAPAKRRRIGTADSSSSIILSPWLPTEPTTISTVEATVGNVGSGEDTLHSTTIEAARVAAAGMVVRGIFWGKASNSANAKTIRLRAIEGANNNIIVALSITVSQANEWLLGFAIIRTSSATVGRASAQANSGPSGGPVSASVTAVTQPTLTWANAVEIRLTGEATADNETTVEGGWITLQPGA